MYTGTGEPRTLDVAKSTVCACWRASRVTSDVGSAAATAAMASSDADRPLAAGGRGDLVDCREALGDRHLAGRHQHPAREKALAPTRRAGADRHRGPQLLDRLAELDVVARGGLGGGGEERGVERAAEALGGVLGLVERGAATSKRRRSERSVHSGERAWSMSESCVTTPRIVSTAARWRGDRRGSASSCRTWRAMPSGRRNPP